MKTIEHDHREIPRRRFAKDLWFPLWGLIVLLWIGQWYFNGFEWTQIALGFGTGVIFAYTIIDYHIAIGKGHEL